MNLVIQHKLPILAVLMEKTRAEDLLRRLQPDTDLRGFLFVAMYMSLEDQIKRTGRRQRAILAGDMGSVDQTHADVIVNSLGAAPSSVILESVRFMESHRSFGVQLADVVGYFLMRKFSRPAARNDYFEQLSAEVGLTTVQEPLGWVLVTGGWPHK